ncbi:MULTISPECIES: DUF808 domain-containing protein [Shewanella]|uniref:DUF808 domain-containing protein n=1 Tax=Shewanella fodinae TaxID=552357 RepID=A0A4R2F2K2_9GAMM|nr:MULTISPECIES: DUF808 domain-containing protein [Shewanella]MBO1271671.1 DUF808 domain-containing protein [Shewanella sp. 4t3-1-2LB]TCN79504.1 hypothetical protein EDC91_13311 [Shewanella fodinae]
MAGASLLMLLDDIATLLDDVAVMSKVAAKKTAGMLSDDLALNAQQVTGFSADRELPVVWAVAKGSLRNKAILVPGALLISAVVPWLILPLLMLGGLFLSFEGFEKVWHKLTHPTENRVDEEAKAAKALEQVQDPQAWEARKVKGAIRTDFVLSAEIIVLTLGIVADQVFFTQLTTLVIIAVVMTAGVYGIVAAIVKLDDLGLYLSHRKGRSIVMSWLRRLGLILVSAAPKLMKLLTVVGTIAMFLVGGGILAHGIAPLAALEHHLAAAASEMATFGSLLSHLLPLLLQIFYGLIAGAIVLVVMTSLSHLRAKFRAKSN